MGDPVVTADDVSNLQPMCQTKQSLCYQISQRYPVVKVVKARVKERFTKCEIRVQVLSETIFWFRAVYLSSRRVYRPTVLWWKATITSRKTKLSLVMLATLVEDDLKAPFLIATTPRWGEGATPFPGLLHFTLDPHLIVLSAKQGGINNHFCVFRMTRPGIESRSPGPLVNTTHS